jgi:hypothetical protein
MSPFNKAYGLAGVAKQVAKGTLEADPVFAHGVAGGKIIDSVPKQDFADVTSGSITPSNVDRTSIDSGVGFDTRAYLKVLGLYLLGLFGSDVVTGAGPYVHTFGLAAAQPYLSVFESYNGALRAMRDVKIDGITLKWKGNEPVTLTVKAAGTVLSFPLTFTPTTDETGSESFLVPVGGTFQIAIVGGVPVMARITEGEIDFNGGHDAVFASGTLEADDPGARTLLLATCKLTVVPEDMAMWNTAATGTSDGSAYSPTAPYGSLAITLKENAGTGSLAITGSKVAFETEYPDVDPKGGNAEIALVGKAAMAVGGTSPLVCVLSNGMATY